MIPTAKDMLFLASATQASPLLPAVSVCLATRLDSEHRPSSNSAVRIPSPEYPHWLCPILFCDPSRQLRTRVSLVPTMSSQQTPPAHTDRYVVIHVATTCDEHGVYVTKDSAEVIELGWIVVDSKTLDEVCCTAATYLQPYLTRSTCERIDPYAADLRTPFC
ncbi:hypothetical protein NUW58_g2917 [Xylaria curta]|uniref:Uncharacterized protein n=1 Tax=Xylaria curta TaxID=42375 RepID=A0ACC1PDV4_9PEZI|nr:hypothetical protein NUW58_g2917 [Xylaria curta]